ncbi:hypothetical protein ACFFON_12955 [Arthrobacter citreus]|uniref:hypothetical protein n=1 Tax=Arthrobacter TaxID=1663 RepID=UPI00126451F2|nr:hypothetical protein [Arthrobacter gandavensis]
MTDQEVQEIAERVAQGLGELTPPDPWRFADAVVLASFALLIVALIFGTISSVNLKHQQSFLEPTVKGRRWQLPRWRWDGAASDLWWSRAQWALEAVTSTGQKRYFYGMVMLESLAKSNDASPGEKAMLDTVWKASFTGMDDEEISRFLEDFQMRASHATQELSAPAPIATAHAETAPDGDPADRRLLGREILAARLKIALDKELNRPTSPAVEQLAVMPLPPMT